MKRSSPLELFVKVGGCFYFFGVLEVWFLGCFFLGFGIFAVLEQKLGAALVFKEYCSNIWENSTMKTYDNELYGGGKGFLPPYKVGKLAVFFSIVYATNAV